MFSLKKKQSGFTIVELLIVIVVIGILATLVIITFTGIQQKARDSKRKTDVGAVQAALESYYSSNNTYPTLAHLNDSTWVASNLKGFDYNALKDPKLGSGVTSPLLSGTTPSATQYAYNVSGAAANCDDSSTSTNPCSNYSISAKLESDGSTISKQSNN